MLSTWRSLLVPVFVIAGTLVAACIGHAQSRTDKIFIAGQSAPDGNGTFVVANNFPAINEQGALAFFGGLTGTAGGTADDWGLFIGDGQTTVQIAREGGLAPGGGMFAEIPNFARFGHNNAGQVAFVGLLAGAGGDSGIFFGDANQLSPVVLQGQASPDLNGVFATFDAFTSATRLNAAGQIAFRGELTNTAGGSADNIGIFLSSGGTLHQIARSGDADPHGNGVFSNFGSGLLNDAGQILFSASLSGTAGGTNDDVGLFRGSVGGVQQIAREGQAAPMNGLFSTFGGNAINGGGDVAFYATLQGTSQGSLDDTGVFRSRNGLISAIAREGDVAPAGDGWFAFLGTTNQRINDVGQVLFGAAVSDTLGGQVTYGGLFRGSGGALTEIVRSGQATPGGPGTFGGTFVTTNLTNSGAVAFYSEMGGTPGVGGIFIGDGRELFEIAREGNVLPSGQIASLGSLGPDGINEHGQVAYRAFVSGVGWSLQRWTPDLHWRQNHWGSWDTGQNWTLGLNPAFVHDVYIDPAVDVTVTGPTSDRWLRNLEIGGGSGDATLRLIAGTVLTVEGAMTIHAGSVLTGDGAIQGEVYSSGTLSPGNSAGRLTMDTLMLDEFSNVFIELGGTSSGSFDQLVVLESLGLSGELFVDLIDGFSLGANQKFVFLDVGGTRTGWFNGLAEGDRVRTFGEQDLYITYNGGDGNDIALYTAVPEPAAGFAILLAGSLVVLVWQRPSRLRRPAPVGEHAESTPHCSPSLVINVRRDNELLIHDAQCRNSGLRWAPWIHSPAKVNRRTDRKRSLIRIAVGSVLCFAATANLRGDVVYYNDFETNTLGFNVSDTIVLPKDEVGGVSTYLGSRTPALNLAALTLNGLVPGKEYSLSFDLYLGGTWDGSLSFGPDTFSLTSSSSGVLVSATFANAFPIGSPTPIQSYSDATPLGDAGLFPTREGADVVLAEPIYYFGRGLGNPILSFVANGVTETLTFRSEDAQGVLDEFFAIDNVVVSRIPEPSLFGLVAFGAGLGLFLRRHRRCSDPHRFVSKPAKG